MQKIISLILFICGAINLKSHVQKLLVANTSKTTSLQFVTYATKTVVRKKILHNIIRIYPAQVTIISWHSAICFIFRGFAISDSMQPFKCTPFNEGRSEVGMEYCKTATCQQSKPIQESHEKKNGMQVRVH